VQVAGAIARYRAREEHAFYLAMSGVFLLLVLVGFCPSYYFRGRVPPHGPLVPMTPLVHLHALLFSSWVVLYAVQTALVARRRITVHRLLGVLGVLLASAMVVVGTLTALHQAARGSGPPSVPPLVWLAVPLLDIPVFAVLAGWAVLSRRTPQVHKRLMLITMVALMSPPVARIPVPAFLPELVVNVVLPDLGLVALAAWDVRSRGALHPVTLLAGSVLVAGQVLRVPLSGTEPWLHFERWAVSLVA
jgi:hypothetical protein